ncbi:unnamed protein product, partial [Bubo scandiacus]
MASLYQRFSGKINTSRSFPVPPEASHLLGAQSSEEDGAAGKTSRPLQQESSRPRFQYQPRSDCEEEDENLPLFINCKLILLGFLPDVLNDSHHVAG